VSGSGDLDPLPSLTQLTTNDCSVPFISPDSSDSHSCEKRKTKSESLST
jgi:hypothetical protein